MTRTFFDPEMPARMEAKGLTVSIYSQHGGYWLFDHVSMGYWPVSEPRAWLSADAKIECAIAELQRRIGDMRQRPVQEGGAA